MGLLIDVSVDFDSIAKAAWTRAVANRERLKRRLDTQEERKKANRKKLPYVTPRPSLYRPDEPVAMHTPSDSDVFGVGNAWLWQTEKITGTQLYGDPSLAGITGPGTTTIEQLTKLGSLDGTQWLEWTDVFSGVPPSPGGPVGPLPYLGPEASFVVSSHSRRLSSFLESLPATNISLQVAKLALPVGPQAMIYVVLKRCKFAYQPCGKTGYLWIAPREPSNNDPNPEPLVRTIFNYSNGSLVTSPEVLIEKAFYVGRSIIREVSVPAGLAASMWDCLPTLAPQLVDKFYFFGLSSSENPLFYQGRGGTMFVEEGFFDIPVPTLEWVTTPPVNPEGSWLLGSGPSATAKNERIENNNEIPNLNILVDRSSTSAAVYPLLAFGNNWKSNPNADQIVAISAKAPVIKPSLKNPSEGIGTFAAMSAFDPTSAINYSPFKLGSERQVADYLYATGGSLIYEGGQTEATNVLATGRQDRTEANPAFYNYTTSEGQTREATWRSYLLTTYDWRNRKYCRNSLLALGFNEEDLAQ